MATDNFPSDGGTKLNHAFELPKNLDKLLDAVMLRGGAQLASLCSMDNYGKKPADVFLRNQKLEIREADVYPQCR